MTNKYVFIGGPYHLQTKATHGQPRFELINPKLDDGPSISTNYSDPFQHMQYVYTYYDLKKVDMFGVIKYFYVHNNLKDEQANMLIGSFIGSLLNLYVES